MDPTQLAALQVAAARVTTAQEALQQATEAVGAAETAHANAATANDAKNKATTSAQVVQAKVAVLQAQNELQCRQQHYDKTSQVVQACRSGSPIRH